MEPIFKHIFWNLTTEEIDLLNILVNLVQRDDSLSGEEFDYSQFGYIIDTNMHELSSCLGFLELKVDTVIQRLESLQIKVATLYHEDDENIFMTKASFVYQYNVTSTNNDINKRLSIVINTKILKILRDEPTLFELLYRFDRYGIKSKYSKIVYERFYRAGRHVETFEIDDLVKALDFGLQYSTMEWSRLNGNILKRVVKEINEKTDLYFEVEKVKSTVASTKRLQTTEIKIMTSTAPEMELPATYYTEDFLMERKIAYYIERDIKHKFTQTSKFKGKEVVKDPEAYLHKLRTDAEKLQDEYKAKVLLQEWLNNIKYNNQDHEGLVILQDYSKDNHFITVNNNYKLYDIEKKVEISTSARDTRIKINAFMKKGDYNIVETEDYMKNCSISYTQG